MFFKCPCFPIILELMMGWKKPLFYLFLKQVKQQRPKLFYLFLSCCALQLLFTVLKLEATPFLLYGMYSEKLPATGSVKMVHVYLDGVSLETLRLSPREKDMLFTNIENYVRMKQNGGVDVVQTRVEQRYFFLTRSALYPLISNRIYNKPADLLRFEAWFRQKCSRLANRNINRVTIIENHYFVDPATLAVAPVAHESIASF